jgi:hypothetical protein
MKFRRKDAIVVAAVTALSIVIVPMLVVRTLRPSADPGWLVAMRDPRTFMGGDWPGLARLANDDPDSLPLIERRYRDTGKEERRNLESLIQAMASEAPDVSLVEFARSLPVEDAGVRWTMIVNVSSSLPPRRAVPLLKVIALDEAVPAHQRDLAVFRLLSAISSFTPPDMLPADRVAAAGFCVLADQQPADSERKAWYFALQLVFTSSTPRDRLQLAQLLDRDRMKWNDQMHGAVSGVAGMLELRDAGK